MNPVFEILPENIVAGQTSIIMEVSEESFGYCVINDATKMITGICMFHFGTKIDEKDIAAILKNIFDEQPLFKKRV